MVSTPPRTFLRLIAEDRIRIRGREFEVVTRACHFLRRPNPGVDLANVSVEAMDPDGDPLGLYLRSLEKLKERLPEDVFVLPGHNLPFVGFSTRADELIAHHEALVRHPRGLQGA